MIAFALIYQQEKETKIIIGNFDERSARKVFCQVKYFKL